MISLRIFLLFFLIFIEAGCATYKVGHFSVLSTKDVDMSHNSQKIGDGVLGQNIKTVWILIGWGLPKVDEAINDALHKTGDGDYMTNVDVEYKAFFIPPIYYRLSYQVKGDVWKFSTDEIIPE